MGKRAANGMGSIRQRPDGRWEARYTAPDGRQHSVFGKTQREASAKLKAALQQVDAGSWIEPSKMTVGDWLDVWLRDYLNHTTGRTKETYECAVNKWFKPTFGNVRLASFTEMHVRRMVSDMERAGRKPYTVQHHCAILSAAMEQAIHSKLIRENPVKLVKLKRRNTAVDIHIVDRLQIPAFVAAAEKTDFPNELIFMLFSGLRVGELRGLRWEDVDLEAGTINVQRQLHATAHKMQFAPPKNGEQRVIHLAPEAVAILKRQRRRQIEQKLAAGDKWIENTLTSGLVFRQDNGRVHSELSIYKQVKIAGAEIGMPDLHPHDLRHSYAVAALRSGADIKAVQHNLGHKSAKMTMDVYAKYTEDSGKTGAERLSTYIQGALNRDLGQNLGQTD